MTFRASLISALDRPMLRPALVALANGHALRLNRGPHLQVFYDDSLKAWGRRARGTTIVDSARFCYDAPQLRVVGERSPWENFAHGLWLDRCPIAVGETVLDIGAEVGTDCLSFARAVGASGRVIAVEANPTTFRMLEYGVRYSPLTNVTLLNLAVAGEPGTVWIEDAADTNGATVGSKTGASGHHVRAKTLDQIASEQDVGPVGLLKMNIEGSERSALETLPDLLQRTRQVIVACHDFRADMGDGEFYRTREYVRERLTAAGFTLDPTDHSAVPTVRDHVVGRRP
jgi:FkbM family methyltransferase